MSAGKKKTVTISVNYDCGYKFACTKFITLINEVKGKTLTPLPKNHQLIHQ